MDESKRPPLVDLFNRLQAFTGPTYPTSLEESVRETSVAMGSMKVHVRQQAACVDNNGARLFKYPGMEEQRVVNAIRYLAYQGAYKEDPAPPGKLKDDPQTVPNIVVMTTESQLMDMLRRTFGEEPNATDVSLAIDVLKASPLAVVVEEESAPVREWRDYILTELTREGEDYRRFRLHPLLSLSIAHESHFVISPLETITPDAQLQFREILRSELSTDGPSQLSMKHFLRETLGLQFKPETGPDDPTRSRFKAFQRARRAAEQLERENLYTFSSVDVVENGHVVDKIMSFTPTEEWRKQREEAANRLRRDQGSNPLH